VAIIQTASQRFATMEATTIAKATVTVWSRR
jgi:hypothetical protein